MPLSATAARKPKKPMLSLAGVTLGGLKPALHAQLHGRILQVPPRFKNGGEAGFPLPSTGRGIEGEGWADQAAFPITSTWAFPPLTPALSPLRGEGDGSASRFYGGASSFTTVLLPRCAPITP